MPPTRRRAAAVIACALSVALVDACGNDADPSAAARDAAAGAAPSSNLVEDWLGGRTDGDALRPTRVAQLPEMATDLVARPHDGSLYVTTRGGLVYRVTPGRDAPPELVLDLTTSTSTEGERGLLGLSFDRSGERLVTVSTAPDGAVVVQSFAAGDGPIDASSARQLASIPHPFAGHNGGDVLRLSDGDFLVSLGDMDTGDQAAPAAQDLSSPLGALALLPEGLVTGTADRREWPAPADLVAKGLRNPWRLAVDPANDDVWIGDVGDSTTEELDRISATSLDRPGTWPLNFGWPAWEGSKATGRDPHGVVGIPPEHEYAHGRTACGVVLGPVLERLPRPADGSQVLFGDLCSRTVSAVGTRGGAARRVAVLPDPPVSFGADGRFAYVMDSSGGVYRLDPATWRVAGVPADAPERPSPLSTVSAPPPEACVVASAFTSMHDDPGMAPDRLRKVVTDASDALDAASATLSSDFDLDTTPIRRLLDDLIAVAGRVGWNLAAPELRAMDAAVRAAQPPYENFGTALARLQDLGGDSCR